MWLEKGLFDNHCLLFCCVFPLTDLVHSSLKGSLLLRAHSSFIAKTTFIQNHMNHIKLPNGNALGAPAMQQSVPGTERCQSLYVCSRPNYSVVSCIFPPNPLPLHQTSEPDTSAMSLSHCQTHTLCRWNTGDKRNSVSLRGRGMTPVRFCYIMFAWNSDFIVDLLQQQQ